MMNASKRIDRKLFLTWSLSTIALGCSAEDDGTPMGSAGTATGGTGGSGVGGSGLGGSSAGSTTGGSTTGGGGSASGGSAGSTAAGTGGTSATGGSGGSGGGAPVAPNCNTQLKTSISANHMHVFMVTTEDVLAGMTKTYDTKGGSDHTHIVTVTAAHFAKLQTGGGVRILTCDHEHEHEYIVNCVGVTNPDTTSAVANYCDTNQPHTCGSSAADQCPALPDKPL